MFHKMITRFDFQHIFKINNVTLVNSKCQIYHRTKEDREVEPKSKFL